MLKIVEKSWTEFWAKYWRIDSRHQIPGIFEWDRQLVDFIEYVCGFSPGQRILDLGCGGGDQAKLFAQKGYHVVGIDIAPSLIDFANRQFEQAGLSGMFLVGDMREIAFEAEFNACLFLSGTFGFFGDAEDRKVLKKVSQALKPGGKVCINLVAPTQAGRRTRTWDEDDSGWELREEWFDAQTASYRSKTMLINRDGTVIVPKREPGYHADESIRCYSVPEMRQMTAAAGLRYLTGYSSRELTLPPKTLQADVARNMIVAERNMNISE